MKPFTKLSIIGYAKSSIAAINFYLQNYPEVQIKVSELKAKESFDQALIKDFESKGVQFEFGKQSIEFLEPSEDTFIMISPGVPPRAPIVQAVIASAAKQSSFLYGTDLDLFIKEVGSNYIAITGTNGKTTTTSLIAHALDLEPVGNIGKAFLNFNPQNKIQVCEISSFQIFYSQLLKKPKAAVYLNLTEDHLDWHKDMQEYQDTKARLFTDESLCVLNFDDPITKALGDKLINKKYFSTKTKVDASVDLIDKDSVTLVGEHNYSNMLAAYLALEAAGLEQTKILEAFKSFKAVPHRLEFVAEINGHKFYNDSKATNPDAAIRSLEAFDKSIVICGGKNKNLDLSKFISKVKEKAHAVIAIGELKEEILNSLDGFENKTPAGSMEEAIKKAQDFGINNNYPIVLAPASSSFDMFDSYEHRGDAFKRYLDLVKPMF